MYINRMGELLCQRERQMQIGEILRSPSDYYTEYTIQKKSGGVRRICAPKPPLKEIQQEILQDIFYGKGVQFRFPEVVCAFLPGRSIVENAAPHVGKEMVLCMDIQNFFCSVTDEMVRRCLREDFSWLGMDEACIQVITGLCTVYGGLPQGAPTSPLLANMVFRKVDYRLKNFAKSRKLSYTRYADDLTFSGMFQKEQVIGVVSGILRDNGFTVQCRKTHVMQKNERQKVTGVIVNEKVRAPKELRKKLRQAAYYIGKYGVENYLSHEGKDPQYLDVLKGQCAFVLQTCDELPIRELIELLK